MWKLYKKLVYFSISNGAFQPSATFGNFSNVPNQAAYITRANPAQIQTPTYLSYTQVILTKIIQN